LIPILEFPDRAAVRWSASAIAYRGSELTKSSLAREITAHVSSRFVKLSQSRLRKRCGVKAKKVMDVL
jgi:hypothetical protein